MEVQSALACPVTAVAARPNLPAAQRIFLERYVQRQGSELRLVRTTDPSEGYHPSSDLWRFRSFCRLLKRLGRTELLVAASAYCDGMSVYRGSVQDQLQGSWWFWLSYYGQAAREFADQPELAPIQRGLVEGLRSSKDDFALLVQQANKLELVQYCELTLYERLAEQLQVPEGLSEIDRLTYSLRHHRDKPDVRAIGITRKKKDTYQKDKMRTGVLPAVLGHWNNLVKEQGAPCKAFRVASRLSARLRDASSESRWAGAIIWLRELQRLVEIIPAMQKELQQVEQAISRRLRAINEGRAKKDRFRYRHTRFGQDIATLRSARFKGHKALLPLLDQAETLRKYACSLGLIQQVTDRLQTHSGGRLALDVSDYSETLLADLDQAVQRCIEQMITLSQSRCVDVLSKEESVHALKGLSFAVLQSINGARAGRKFKRTVVGRIEARLVEPIGQLQVLHAFACARRLRNIFCSLEPNSPEVVAEATVGIIAQVHEILVQCHQRDEAIERLRGYYMHPNEFHFNGDDAQERLCQIWEKEIPGLLDEVWNRCSDQILALRVRATPVRDASWLAMRMTVAQNDLKALSQRVDALERVTQDNPRPLIQEFAKRIRRRPSLTNRDLIATTGRSVRSAIGGVLQKGRKALEQALREDALLRLRMARAVDQVKVVVEQLVHSNPDTYHQLENSFLFLRDARNVQIHDLWREDIKGLVDACLFVGYDLPDYFRGDKRCGPALFRTIDQLLDGGKWEGLKSLFSAVNPNLRDRCGQTILHHLATRHESEAQVLFRWLVERRAANIHAADARGVRPLHEAAMAGASECVNYLIQRGAVVNLKSRRGTPLELAQFYQHQETVHLIQEACGFTRGDRARQLLDAVHSLDVANVQAIPNLPQIVNRVIDGQLPLVALFRKEDVETDQLAIASVLLQAGADIDLPEPVSGDTALHAAVEYTVDPDLMRFVLKWRPNPNVVNRAGDTPLHVAATCHRVHWTRELIRVGADARIGSKGNSVLAHWCDRSCATAALAFRILLQEVPEKCKADPNGDTELGYALHHAYHEASRQAVRTLLRHGASPFALGHAGMYGHCFPVEVTRRGSDSLKQPLLAHMAASLQRLDVSYFRRRLAAVEQIQIYSWPFAGRTVVVATTRLTEIVSLGLSSGKHPLPLDWQGFFNAIKRRGVTNLQRLVGPSVKGMPEAMQTVWPSAKWCERSKSHTSLVQKMGSVGLTHIQRLVEPLASHLNQKGDTALARVVPLRLVQLVFLDIATSVGRD